MPLPDLPFESLNRGFAVAITIRAKEGEGDAVGAILESLVAPTMPSRG